MKAVRCMQQLDVCIFFLACLVKVGKVSCNTNLILICHIYPQYRDTLTPDHTWRKFWMTILLAVDVPKNFRMIGKQCRPWSDASLSYIWSGSATLHCLSSSFVSILRVNLVCKYTFKSHSSIKNCFSTKKDNYKQKYCQMRFKSWL